MKRNSPIAVLGAGSWGTALAVLLARNGQPVRLWGRNAQFMADLGLARRNLRFLPDIAFPDSLELSSDLNQTIAVVRDILISVPSHAFSDTLLSIRTHLRADARIAWATKGLQPESGSFLHSVAAGILGDTHPLAVISGPTFAHEVAMGAPTAITVASDCPEFAQALAARLHNDAFRAYTCQDVTGVELGGAVKNVLAIAAGIADGLGLGANTRAALISRGLAEMMRLGVALGGQRETFMGLAGLGDLVLTCTDDLSRNRRLGLALARGASLEQTLADIGQVVEGVPTAREIMRVAAELNIEMPIVGQVYAVLYENRSPRAAVQALLNREPRAETS